MKWAPAIVGNAVAGKFPLSAIIAIAALVMIVVGRANVPG